MVTVQSRSDVLHRLMLKRLASSFGCFHEVAQNVVASCQRCFFLIQINKVCIIYLNSHKYILLYEEHNKFFFEQKIVGEFPTVNFIERKKKLQTDFYLQSRGKEYTK